MALQVVCPWMMWSVTIMVFVAVTSVVVSLAFGGFTKETPKKRESLPRGRWSLPIVGDGWQLKSQGIHQFLNDNFVRFGDPFRLSLLGRTVVVMNTVDSIKNVLSTASATFPPQYTENINVLLYLKSGKILEPKYHQPFRKLVLAVGNPCGDKLSFINSRARETLDSWERLGTVNTCDEITKFTHSVIMHFSWSDITSCTDVQSIREELECLDQGMYVPRINLPHFSWYKALKAQESLYARAQESLTNRRKQGILHEDLLGGLMEVQNYSDEDICGLLVAAMYAGYTSLSLVIQWIIKYLHDYPTVREAIQAEQDGIHEKMTEDNFFESFSVKSCMPLTAQMIDEVLRLHGPPIIPRRTKEAVDFKGFVIPKGSDVWASLCSIHMNAKFFPNPSMFNPSRFKTPVQSSTFMPFGAGPYLCPGSNLAKSEAAFVVHHLLTKYSWESVGSCEAFSFSDSRPTQRPTGGLIIVRRRCPGRDIELQDKRMNGQSCGHVEVKKT